MLSEYQADITLSISIFGNFNSSHFGCGQFINDLCLNSDNSDFLIYSDTEKRHIPKYTITDWKEAIDSQNKEESIAALNFFKDLNKNYAERYKTGGTYRNVDQRLYDENGCKQLRIFANTDIQEGEELSLAYGVQYWMNWGTTDFKSIGLKDMLKNGVNWIDYMSAETEKMLTRALCQNSDKPNSLR